MHSPLLHHGAQTAIGLSVLAREHFSALRKVFFAIVAIIIVLAIAGWPHDKAVTCILNPTVDLRRIWYVLVKIQVQMSSRSCKTPHNYHHHHCQHDPFCPLHRHQKKQSPCPRLLMTTNGQMNKRYLFQFSVTYGARGHGTGFLNGPG
jgi:hypothetical protein